MPSPYADPTKIAKKLQEEAKKIQETRSSLQKELDELEKISEDLSKIGIKIDLIEAQIKNIKDLFSKKALDLDGIRNSLDILKDQIKSEFSKEIKGNLLAILKKIQATYADTILDVKIREIMSALESWNDVSEISGVVKKIIDFENDLRAAIRCPTEAEELKNFYACADYMINYKRDFSQKLQSSLMQISKYEAFSIKNKLNTEKYTDFKERSRENYKNLRFDESIRLMNEYMDALKNEIRKYLLIGVEEIKGKLENIKTRGIDVSSIEESIEKLNLDDIQDPAKIQQSIKKLNDQIDTLLFDFAVKKLSSVSASLESIRGLKAGPEYRNKLEYIRNLIKSQKIEEALQSLKELEEDIDNLKEKVSIIRQQIDCYNKLINEHEAIFTKDILLAYKTISKDENIDPISWDNLKIKIDGSIESFFQIKKEILEKAVDFMKGIGIEGFEVPQIPNGSYENAVEIVNALLDTENKATQSIKNRYISLINEAKELKLDIECPDPKDDIIFLIDNYNKCAGVLKERTEKEEKELDFYIFNEISALESINKKFSRIRTSIGNVRNLQDVYKRIVILRDIENKLFNKLINFHETFSSVLKLKEETVDRRNISKTLSEEFEKYRKEVEGKVSNIISLSSVLKLKELGIAYNEEELQDIPQDEDSLLKLKLRKELEKIESYKWYYKLIGENNSDIDGDIPKLIAIRALEEFYKGRISSESFMDILCLRDFEIEEGIDYNGDEILQKINDEEIKKYFNLEGQGTYKELLIKKASQLLKMRKEGNMNEKILEQLNRDPIQGYFNALREIAKTDSDKIIPEISNIILDYMSNDFIRSLIIRDSNFSNSYESEVLKRVTSSDFVGAYIGLYNIIKDYIQILGLIRASSEYKRLFSSEPEFLKQHSSDIQTLDDAIKMLDVNRSLALLSSLVKEFDNFRYANIREKVEGNWRFIRGVLTANIYMGTKCFKESEGINEIYRKVFEENMEELKSLSEPISHNLAIKIGTAEKLGEYLFIEKIHIVNEVVREIKTTLQAVENALIYFMSDEILRPLIKEIDNLSSERLIDLLRRVKNYEGNLNLTIKDYSIKFDNKFKSFFEGEIDYGSLFTEIIIKELIPQEFLKEFIDENRIRKRIEDLINSGVEVKKETMDELHSLTIKLRPDIAVSYKKVKGDKSFKIHFTVTNQGTWKLYNSHLSWLDQEREIGDIQPEDTLEFIYEYNNKKDEPFKISGELLDFTMYEKIVTVERLLTYTRSIAEKRNICAACRGVILPKMDMVKCDYCGAVYHLKCAERNKSCKVCGIEFDI